MTDAIHYMSLSHVAEAIRVRRLSSLEVANALIARIERLNPKLNGVLLLMADHAREAARVADREIAAGLYRGPLHGVPIGMKDVVWTKGFPTSSGMASRREFIYPEDATLVTRLRAAGAVILAKLHMTEGAKFDHDPLLPRPSNPWSEEHWTGVSSSGSGVAVAAGLVFAAVATDSGGSVRTPASATGATGLKPTTGRVSRHGIFHSLESLDTVGAIARNAADAALVVQAMAGIDPKDPTTLATPTPNFLADIGRNLDGLTIGIDWRYAAEGIDEEVVATLRNTLAAFESLGARTREIEVPWGMEQALGTLSMIVAEMGKAAQDHFPEASGSASLTGRNEGGDLKATDVVRGYVERDRVRGAMEAVLSDVDFIISPALGKVIPTWEDIVEMGNDVNAMLGQFVRFTAVYNLSTVPSISFPGGFSTNGLPIGMQLAAPRLKEASLIRAVSAFQRVTDFHTRRPPLD